MPSAKRSPINYAPTFGGGIFRSKSEVEGDLALLVDGDPVDDHLSESARIAPSDHLSSNEVLSPNERTNDLRSESDTHTSYATSSTNERTNERMRVRHSFDIYRDQLISLGDVQITRHRKTGRKPKLGDLVQEALDAFIASHVRTNERTNGHDERE